MTTINWAPANPVNNSGNNSTPDNLTWTPANSNNTAQSKNTASSSPLSTLSALEQLGSGYTKNVIVPDAKAAIAGAGTALQNIVKGMGSANLISPTIAPGLSKNTIQNNPILNTNLNNDLNVPDTQGTKTWGSIGQAIPAGLIPGVAEGEGVAGLALRALPNATYGAAANPNSPLSSAATYAGGSAVSDILKGTAPALSNLSENLNPVQFTKNIASELGGIYNSTKDAISQGTGSVGKAINSFGQRVKAAVSAGYQNVSDGSKLLNNGDVISSDLSVAPSAPQYVTAKQLPLSGGNTDPMANWDQLPQAKKDLYIATGYVKPAPPAPSQPSAPSPFETQVNQVLPPDIQRLLTTTTSVSPTLNKILGKVKNSDPIGTIDPQVSFDNFHDLAKDSMQAARDINPGSPGSNNTRQALINASNHIKQNILIPHLQQIDNQFGTNLVDQFKSTDFMHGSELSNFNNPSFKSIRNAYTGLNTDPDIQSLNKDIQKGISTESNFSTESNPQTVIDKDSYIGSIAPGVKKLAAFEKSPELMDIVTGANQNPSIDDLSLALQKSGAHLPNADPDLKNAYDSVANQINVSNKSQNKLTKLAATAGVASGHPISALALYGADSQPVIHKGIVNALKLGVGTGKAIGKTLNALKAPFIIKTVGTGNVNNNINQ